MADLTVSGLGFGEKLSIRKECYEMFVLCVVLILFVLEIFEEVFLPVLFLVLSRTKEVPFQSSGRRLE